MRTLRKKFTRLLLSLSIFCFSFGYAQDYETFRAYTKEVSEKTLKEDTANLRSIEQMQREIAKKMHLKTVFKNEVAENTMLSFWDSSPEFVVIGSRYDRTFIWVNLAFANYLGYEREELLHIDFFKLIRPDYISVSMEERIKYNQTSELHFEGGEFKNYYRHKNGYYLPVYWYEMLINDKENYLVKASFKGKE